MSVITKLCFQLFESGKGFVRQCISVVVNKLKVEV